jgi:hypothetical protein
MSSANVRLRHRASFSARAVGFWRGELSAHIVQRLIDVHGETMHRFGYLDENKHPV